MAASEHVINTTAERFEADVFERSKQTLVVLDFWAAWCQPCRMLSPILERAVAEHAGRFVLVKADTDQLPQHALAFNVQGIPAVFAVRDGKVVDAFQGLLTEAQLKEWLTRLLPSEAELLAQAAAGLEASDPAAAEEKYREALAQMPSMAGAKIGLARVLLAADKADEAKKLLYELNERGFLEPDAEKLQAQVNLVSRRISLDALTALRKEASAAPKNLAKQLELAGAELAATNYEAGLQACLRVVEADTGAQRKAARELMLSAFRVLGDESELTRDYRRKLSMALY